LGLTHNNDDINQIVSHSFREKLYRNVKVSKEYVEVFVLADHVKDNILELLKVNILNIYKNKKQKLFDDSTNKNVLDILVDKKIDGFHKLVLIYTLETFL
jgi:hypothetical protein